MKTYHVLLCPYCDRILDNNQQSCCGEVGHASYSYVNEDGERLVEVNEDNYNSEFDNIPEKGYSVLDESLWGYDYE